MEVAGVVPKRLGLKFGPVATLALEYEDTRDARKLKLAVVELPHLTLHATPSEMAANVQKEHQLFAPSLVNEDQLVRLMQRLLQSQRDLLAKSDDTETTQGPKAGASLAAPNTTPTKAESNNDDKELASDEEDVGEDSARDASDDDTEQEQEHAQAPPVAESRSEKPEAQSQPATQPRAAVETAKDDSEFDESFEEESFVEASGDKGSFLTQPPTTKQTDDDDDSDTESTKGKFGAAPARAEPVVAQPTPAAAKAVDTPKDTNEKKATKIDESADDIPSEEELEYFSGGDESGDDDGF